MIVDMILFAFMAMKYKYINVSDQSEREKLENSSKQERKESNAIDNPAFKNEVDDA